MKNYQKLLILALIILAIIVGGVCFSSKSNDANKPEIKEVSTSAILKNYEEVERSIIGYNSTDNTLIILENTSQIPSSITPIQVTPYKTIILSQKPSPDNNYIYYALASELEYGLPGRGVGYGPEFTVAFRYNKEKKYSEELFTGDDVPSKYPHSIDISPEGKRVAFGLFRCNNCDGGIYTIIVYDPDSPNYLKSEKYKNLGEVLDFKFTGPTTYQYAEAIPDEKCTSEAGACLKPGIIHTGEY